MERRQHTRFRVEFRSKFSGAHLEGQGAVADMSVVGCQMQSETPIPPGESVEMRIYIPDLDWPLRVDLAQVRWADGWAVGIEFIRLPAEDLARLRELVTDLEP
jgi:hypothetical protein